MISETSREKVVLFFESIDKYYGCKTEITEGLHSSSADFDANAATWNMCEFELVRSAYRNKGERLMISNIPNATHTNLSNNTEKAFSEPPKSVFILSIR